MTAEETLRVVHEWYGLSSRGDWRGVLDLLGPNYTRHEASGTRTVSAEAQAANVRESFATRGPLRWEYDAFAEGDTAFVTWVARGAHAGDMSGVQVYRVADGRLVETWLSAVAPVTWTLHPSQDSGGDPEASKRILKRWYEEMYEQRRFEELAPQLCGPVFTRHEAGGTFEVTAEQHGERLAKGVAARDAREGRTRIITDYRAFAAGDRVGVIATSAKQWSSVQTWRVEGGRFVESWWAGYAQVDW